MAHAEIIPLSARTRLILGGSLRDIGQFYDLRRIIFLVDANILKTHRRQIPGDKIIEIPSGEPAKTLETIHEIYERFFQFRLDRESFVVGVGGGVTCDLTGFAASTYLRGVPFGLAPTTLLAQVDAAFGGKNGVNFQAYKNLIGTFTQPDLVLVDFDFLKTLPVREIRSGLAEVVKHALIADPELFIFLEQHLTGLLALDEATVRRIVADSIRIKMAIVQEDEREKNERRKLNFGHTFAHALEKAYQLSHGEAVAWGMLVAAELSVRKGLLPAEGFERLRNLLAALKFSALIGLDRAGLIDAVHRDKKGVGETIHFILLEKIGRAVISPIDVSELEAFVNEPRGTL